jgi:hypothetical protein
MRRLLASIAFAMLAGVSVSAAHAADRQFCGQYAKSAVVQVRSGLASRNCVGGVQGDRWVADYQAHFDWCLENSYAASGAERDARAAYLKACAAKPGTSPASH